MAEINAAIPMSFQYGPTVGEHFQNAVKLADMMDQRKQRALEAEQTRQSIAQQAAINPLQIQAAQQNLVNQQQQYQQNQQKFPVEMDQAKITYEKMLLENKNIIEKRKKENLEIMAKAADNIIDEPTYQAWRKFAQDHIGGDTSDMPDTYGPDAQMLIKNIKSGYEGNKVDQFGKTPTGLDLKYATDPEYVKSQEEILKSYLDNGKISQESYNALSGVVKTRPVSWQSQLPMFLSLKETSQKLDIAKTGTEIEKLNLEKEKVAREEAQNAAKAKEAESNAEQYAQNTLSKIDNLINDITSGKTRTGMTADAWARYITSSDAATQKAYFDQIKNTLTVQKLLDIKAQGGTFGALSEKELELLTKSASNLDFAGSKERNIAALKEIKSTILAAKKRKIVTSKKDPLGIR